MAEGVPTSLAVVPCGIDGTLANQMVETTVGFHTACQVKTHTTTHTLTHTYSLSHTLLESMLDNVVYYVRQV